MINVSDIIKALRPDDFDELSEVIGGFEVFDNPNSRYASQYVLQEAIQLVRAWDDLKNEPEEPEDRVKYLKAHTKKQRFPLDAEVKQIIASLFDVDQFADEPCAFFLDNSFPFIRYVWGEYDDLALYDENDDLVDDTEYFSDSIIRHVRSAVKSIL